MSSTCFLRSTTHISLYSIHQMMIRSKGSTLRSLWATKLIFVCTEYFSYIWLFWGLSPRHTGFKPSTVHVGFVVGNLAEAHVLQVLRFTPVTVIPPMLTITLHSFVKQAGKVWEPVSGNIYVYIYLFIFIYLFYFKFSKGAATISTHEVYRNRRVFCSFSCFTFELLSTFLLNMTLCEQTKLCRMNYIRFTFRSNLT